MSAILILISIILLSWVSNLKNDIKSLEKRLENLEHKFLAREEQDFGKSEIILAAKAKEAETEARTETEAEKPIIVKNERILTERIINKENKPKENVELRIGRWLNRLGVVAIVIGISFFLKYSFDNNWIGPLGRILIGIMAGIALWGAGEYTKTKYPVYAQGLLGGGSLTVFLSLYAGYSYYNLYSQAAAFIALVVVMGATVAMALRHDSLAIGILGIIGGYVTPFMVSSHTPSPWVLFGYLTVLTLGVLIISAYRQWTIFNHLSFAFNELIILLWMVSYGFRKQFFTPTLIFLIVVFVLYLGISSIYNIRKNKVSSLPEIAMVGFNAFFFFVWSYNLLSETLLHNYRGFYAVLLALVYIFIGRYAFKFFKTDKKQVIALFGIALVLLTLAIPIQFESAFIIAFLWLAEASGLLFVGSLTKINRIKYCSLAVLILGLFAGLDLLDSLYRSVPFFINEATGFMLFAILTTANMWKVFKKEAPKATMTIMLIGLTLMEMLVFLTAENFHFFEHYKFAKAYLNPEQLSLSFIWLFYAISLFLWGYRKKNKYFRFVGIGLISVVIAKAFLLDLASLGLVYKIILFIIVGLCSLGISFLYQRNKELFNDEERG